MCKFQPIFDTIISTLKSKDDFEGQDFSDSDEFSSDSDDEETNLLNKQIKDVSEPTKCRVSVQYYELIAYINRSKSKTLG